jgi:excisionase family DNA binding protein
MKEPVTPTWIQKTIAKLEPHATTEEAMAALRCSRRTLSRLISSGRIHAVRRSPGGPSRLMITSDSIAAYLCSLEHAA